MIWNIDIELHDHLYYDCLHAVIWLPIKLYQPMSFTFSLLQFERSQSPVDTNFQPDDLVTLPVIKSSPYTATVCVQFNTQLHLRTILFCATL